MPEIGRKQHYYVRLLWRRQLLAICISQSTAALSRMRDVCVQHMLMMIVCNWQNARNVVMPSMDTNSQKLYIYLSLTDTKSVGNNTIEWLLWRRQSRTIGNLLLLLLLLVLFEENHVQQHTTVYAPHAALKT